MSEENQSLNSILNAETPAPQPKPADPPSQPAAKDGEAGNEAGKGEKAAEAKSDAPPASAAEKPKQDTIPFDTFHAVKKDLERKIKQLERQLKSPPQPRSEVPLPDPISDPDGHAKALTSRFEQVAVQNRIEMSREMMADQPDFEEMEQLFIEESDNDPSLVEKMIRSANPAKFAYETAKRIKAQKEIGDPVHYGEKMRQQGLQEAMAKVDEIVAEKLKEALSGVLPKSIADLPTQGGRVTNPTGFNGPKPLADILNRK